MSGTIVWAGMLPRDISEAQVCLQHTVWLEVCALRRRCGTACFALCCFAALLLRLMNRVGNPKPRYPTRAGCRRVLILWAADQSLGCTAAWWLWWAQGGDCCAWCWGV